MPHNRAKREDPIRATYGFVVFADTEVSALHLALAAVDVFYTGGTYTTQYIKDELGDFGEKVVTRMMEAGFNPVNETVYGGVMKFQNWEKPLQVKIHLPEKYVPYIAGRKRDVPAVPSEPGIPVQVELEEDHMRVSLRKDSGAEFMFDGVFKVPLNTPEEKATLETMFNGGALFPIYAWNTPGVAYPPSANTDSKKITYFNTWIDNIPTQG